MVGARGAARGGAARSDTEGMRSIVARGRLTDRAYWYVRNGILRGDLPPGTVLGEAELAEAIGGSRTPVRQALGLLLQEGLIEIGPRRQTIVRGFTPAHRQEMLLLREALEGVAVRRACEVMELGDIDHLRILIIRQRRAAAGGRDDEFLELDEQFHLKIAEGARLPILHAFLGQLRGFVRVARVGASRPPRVLEEVVSEHERIVDALEARDVPAALRALEDHLERSDYSAVRATVEVSR
jgi:GntR family transcriptional regulator, rspAB operon transcriptional repressor